MTLETRGLDKLADYRPVAATEATVGQEGFVHGGDLAGTDEPAPHSHGGPYRRWGKRIVDLSLVLFSAPVWMPVTALLALLVTLQDGNPFYSQLRVGKGGRVFRLWKIRSMVRNADQLLAEHLERDPLARAEWDRMQKLSHDPRITRLGCMIRKTSLDELPQLWNVLIGDMSLVGPRPIMVDQRDLYLSSAYYRLLPGLTGPWQVSSRNGASFVERARFDAEYEARLSLAEDFRLILRTFLVVARATGK